MPTIRLEANESTTVDTTSDEQEFIGHITASAVSIADGVAFNGAFALDVFIDGQWIESEEFDAEGVYPGFNAVIMNYRLRVKTVPSTTGAIIKAVVIGRDRTNEVPY